jgi:crotonobetainyl-CoA:carnitine CoA-transferase CaiB-like acyl-CoA transferase
MSRGDSHFATPNARSENSEALIAVLDQAFSKRSLVEWKTVLGAAGIGTISTVDENACDPQMIAAKAFVPFRDGSALTVNSPFEIDGVTKIASTKRPSVGQHNDEILGVWVRRALSRPDPTKSKIMTMNRKDAAAGAFFVAVLTLGYSGFFVVNLQ